MFKIIWKCPLKIIIATCDQFQGSTLHVKVATRYHLGSLFPPDDSQPGQRPPQPGPISAQRSTVHTLQRSPTKEKVALNINILFFNRGWTL